MSDAIEFQRKITAFIKKTLEVERDFCMEMNYNDEITEHVITVKTDDGSIPVAHYNAGLGMITTYIPENIKKVLEK